MEHLLCVSLCVDTSSSVTLSSSGHHAVRGKISNPKQASRRTTRAEKILKPCEEEFKERKIFIFLLKKESAGVVWLQAGKPGPIRESWRATDFDLV